jgi:hypothetical protein
MTGLNKVRLRNPRLSQTDKRFGRGVLESRPLRQERAESSSLALLGGGTPSGCLGFNGTGVAINTKATAMPSTCGDGIGRVADFKLLGSASSIAYLCPLRGKGARRLRTRLGAVPIPNSKKTPLYQIPSAQADHNPIGHSSRGVYGTSYIITFTSATALVEAATRWLSRFRRFLAVLAALAGTLRVGKTH